MPIYCYKHELHEFFLKFIGLCVAVSFLVDPLEAMISEE